MISIANCCVFKWFKRKMNKSYAHVYLLTDIFYVSDELLPTCSFGISYLVGYLHYYVY